MTRGDGRGRRDTPTSRREHCRRLLAAGATTREAADQSGVSQTTAWRIAKALTSSGPTEQQITNLAKLPAPRTFDELPPIGQECLRDFQLFAETFFCTRVSPWWTKVADAAVADIANDAQTYTLLSAPSGVGKTTLFSRGLILWLLAGGGTCDPARGRALRFMYLGPVQAKATQVVSQLARILED